MKDTVPDFEMDDDYLIPSSFPAGHGGGGGGLARPKKNPILRGDDDDIIELLWQNGQLFLQSQNQRSFKKSPNGNGGGGGGEGVAELPQSNMSNHHHHQQLFMQEDEMESWLHYPMSIDDDDSPFVNHSELYSDELLYPPPSTPAVPSSPPRQNDSVVTEIRPITPPPTPLMASSVSTVSPVPPPPATEAATAAAAHFPKFQNFTYFSRLPKAARIDQPGPSTSPREHTVVNSNETPAMGTESRVSRRMEADSGMQLYSSGNVRCGSMTMTASVTAAGTSTTAGGLTAACEPTVTSSSPSASGGSTSASAEPPPRKIHKPSTSGTGDRKRKIAETEDTECRSEDIEFESVDEKKKSRGSTSTKRSRAAEVHNLSERRRRDRINERMRALQELIPLCTKSDKASMLDEAIEYLKSLQLQVQMMTMGYGMLPMMYPGMQQYMPAMGLGMGMGLGMEVGMNRPMMPYPCLLPTSGMPNLAVVPAFHMRPLPVLGLCRVQAPNQLDPAINSLAVQSPNQARLPNFADPYQQFIGLRQAQVSLPQNHAVVQPSKPSSSKGLGNPENLQSG